MKRLLLIVLVFVLLISGCIGGFGGGGPTANDGIIIRDFSFDYSPIYAEETIGLTLEVENVGEEIGTLNRVTVYGVDYSSGESSELSWGLPDGKFRMTTGDTDFPTQPLYPPDPTTGFEGDSWYHSWLPQAPSYIRTPTSYSFDVRVEYSYRTTYTGTVRIIDNDYLRTLSKNERDQLIQQGGIVESSLTGGPLNLIVASGRHFIVRSSDSEPRSIKFKITNVGSGFPYSGSSIGSDNLYKIRLTSAAPSDFIDCRDSEGNNPEIALSRGQNGVLSCIITVPGLDSTVWNNKLDKKFSITLEYEYYVDGEASITVNPTYEGGTPPSPGPGPGPGPGVECTSNGDCCSNVGGGPCGPEEMAYCNNGVCECGGTQGEECPPSAPGS
jgi:hypothetical protein